MKNVFLYLVLLIIPISLFAVEGADSMYYKRNFWFYSQRFQPFDSIPPGAMQNALSEKENITSQGYFLSPQNSWVSIGPAPLYGRLSGRLNFVTFADENTLIIGGPAGLWKSTNYSSNADWVFMDPNHMLNSYASGAIAVYNSTNPLEPPTTIYYGTGEGYYGGSYNYFGDGIYKTTNMGESWSNISNDMPDGILIFRIAVRPEHYSWIFAATNKGLYRTTNGGVNWTIPSNVSGHCNDIVFADEYKAYAVGPNSGFPGIGYKVSTNGGETFEAPENTNFYPVGRTHISICKEYPDNIYAVTDSGNLKVFYSSNAGVTFNGGKKISGSTAQGGYNIFITADPETPNVAYIGGVYLYTTADYGNNFCNMIEWGCGDNDNLYYDYHNMAFNPENYSDAAVVSDGGIYFSTSGGNIWNDLNTSSLSSNIVYRYYSGYIGIQDAGFAIGGNSVITTGFDGGSILQSKFNPNILIGITCCDGHIRRSTSQNNDIIIPGTWATAAADWVAPLAEHPTTAGYFLTARRNTAGNHINIWRSTDYGANWGEVPFGNGIDANCAPQCLAFSIKDPQIMYMSSSGYFGPYPPPFTFGRGLFKSTDGGLNWTVRIPEDNEEIIPWRYISRVITAPAENSENPDEIYITLSGFFQQSNEGHVFKSTNEGSNWININGNLPNTPVNDIIYWYNSCESPVKMLAVATDIGVFCSSNRGDTWKELADGLDLVPVMDIEYTPFQNKITAATYGRGLWEVGTGITYITNVMEPIGNSISSNNDIIICNGGKLKLRDGQTITMTEDKKIIINDGGEIEVTSGTAHFSGTNWGGIEIYDNGTWDVSSASIGGAQTSISLIGTQSSFNNININNVDFETTGPIYIDSRSNVEIANCTFNYLCPDPENLPVFAIAINGSDNINIEDNVMKTSESPGSCELFLLSSTAISINYGSNISIQNNTITDINQGIIVSNSSPLIYKNIISTSFSADIGIGLNYSYSSTLKQNTISSYLTGISLYSSSPVMYLNEVTTGINNSRALYAEYNSYPRLKPIFEEEGVWDAGKNILESNTSGYGIEIYAYSIPDVDIGCNTINGSTRNIYGRYDPSCMGAIIDYYATYNTWNNPSNNYICDGTVYTDPTGCDLPGGGDLVNPYIIVNYGNGVFDTIYTFAHNKQISADKLLFMQAMKKEYLNNFSGAFNIYKDVLINYQDSTIALSSLKRLLRCMDRLQSDFFAYNQLRAYYLNLVSNNQTDTTFVQVAGELASKCLVRMESYSGAINEYEEVISTSNDSLQVLGAELNVIETYMIMHNNGNVKSFTGKFAQLKPLTVKDGFRMIHEKLYGKHNPGSGTFVPLKFSLSQNYPNPFNPVTKINYSIPIKSNVTLKVYDILGRLVKTVVNEFKDAGYYTVTFDGTGLASGVYFYSIEAGSFRDSKKMVLIK